LAGEWGLPLVTHERYVFARPGEEDVAHVAGNLRAADREEGYAHLGHRRALDALRLSVAASDDVVCAYSAWGEPVALVGVATLSALYGIGCPWMVATDRVEAYRRAFIECGRLYTAAMLERYESLANHVDARNTRSIAWLKRIGFELGPAEPYGALGLPFHPFRIGRT